MQRVCTPISGLAKHVPSPAHSPLRHPRAIPVPPRAIPQPPPALLNVYFSASPGTLPLHCNVTTLLCKACSEIDAKEGAGGYAAKVHSAGASYADNAAMCQREYAMLRRFDHVNILQAAGARYANEEEGPPLNTQPVLFCSVLLCSVLFCSVAWFISPFFLFPSSLSRSVGVIDAFRVFVCADVLTCFPHW